VSAIHANQWNPDGRSGGMRMEILRNSKIVDMRSEDASGCPAIALVSFCRETPKCSVLVLDLGLDLDLDVAAA